MSAVQFNTSGVVRGRNDGRLQRAANKIMPDSPVKWSDLSTLTRGYIEELFRTSRALVRGVPISLDAYGFSCLAPETLAQIIEDCAWFQATDAWRAMLVRGLMSPEAMPHDAGRALWNTRNGGAVEPNFWDDYWTDYSGGTDLAEAVADLPPATLYVADCKVYLRDSAPIHPPGGHSHEG